MAGPRWLECEDEFLAINYGKKNIAWISLRLGKSEKCIRMRAMLKGLKSSIKRGAPICEDTVKAMLVTGVPPVKIAADLGCTTTTVIRISRNENIKTQQRIKKAELDAKEMPPKKVFTNLSTTDLIEMAKKPLPHNGGRKVRKSVPPNNEKLVSDEGSMMTFRPPEDGFEIDHQHETHDRSEISSSYYLSNQFLRMKL